MYHTKGFQVLKEVITPELADFLHRYLLLKEGAARELSYNYGYQAPYWGTFTDEQVPGAWSCYGDVGLEALLIQVMPTIAEVTNTELVPTYSYTRVYRTGDSLAKHKDRPSCSISCTLNIGGDPWPIFIEDLGGGTHKCTLAPGEGIVYQGQLLDHWREELKGTECTQAFLHYNDKSSKEANLYDGRPKLGMPAYL